MCISTAADSSFYLSSKNTAAKQTVSTAKRSGLIFVPAGTPNSSTAEKAMHSSCTTKGASKLCSKNLRTASPIISFPSATIFTSSPGKARRLRRSYLSPPVSRHYTICKTFFQYFFDKRHCFADERQKSGREVRPDGRRAERTMQRPGRRAREIPRANSGKGRKKRPQNTAGEQRKGPPAKRTALPIGAFIKPMQTGLFGLGHSDQYSSYSEVSFFFSFALTLITSLAMSTSRTTAPTHSRPTKTQATMMPICQGDMV